MAKRIPDLTALSGAGSANDDNLVIFDTDANETKRILRSQLADGLVVDLAALPLSAASLTVTDLSANQAVLTDAAKKLVSVTTTGTGSVVRATSPTITGPSVSSGNLTFSGTAQRITGDMSNATLANRLAFQTSTTNGNTTIHALPNGTAAISAFRAFNNSDPTNAGYAMLYASSSEVQVTSTISGTGTYLPMTFYTGNSEAMRIDTSRNVGIGTVSPQVRLHAVSADGVTNARFAGASYALRVQSIAATGTVVDATNNTEATYQPLLIGGAQVQFTIAGAERMRIDASGNVGIGRAPNYNLDVYRSGTTTVTIAAANDNIVNVLRASGSTEAVIGPITSHPLVLLSANTERMRFLAGGGITSEDRADAVGYKGTPLNEQSTAYTLVIGDMGKSIVHPASDNNARTFTIPANGTVPFPVGTTITFINMINTVTIAITTDTMYLAGAGTTGSRTLAAYGMATAVKMTSTTWIISGNGLT